MNTNDVKPKSSNLWDVIKSIFSAMLGVQSHDRAGQDFQTGNAKTFIIVGLVMFVAFISALVWVVSLVLPTGG